jgi:hypothetical protein
VSTKCRGKYLSDESGTVRITKSRPSFAGRALPLLLISGLAPAGATAQDAPEAPAPPAVKLHRPAPEKKPVGAPNADKSRSQKGDAPPPEPAADSQPLAPKTQAEPVGELQPVLHARQAKLTTCMDNVIRQSGQVIDRAHSAISTWSKNAPNENAFQSIIGLTYANSAAPNGLALIFAAPIGVGKCEGESVQIYPTSQSCTKVHADLLGFGQTIGAVGNLPIVETKDGGRDILIPSAGSGCVIVSVRIH